MKTLLITCSILIFSTFNFAQKLDWANPIGGTSPDVGYAVCSDANGNVYYAGEFQGIVDFDPSGGTDFLTSYGNKDGFLVKFDTDGNYQWAVNIGGVDIDGAADVDVDTYGNIYVTGYSRQTAYFNPADLDDTLIAQGGSDIYVAKYDPNGNYQWAFNVGSSGNDWPTAIDIDDNNRLYLTGSYDNGLADFDPGTPQFLLTNFVFSNDFFVAKYDINQNFYGAFGIGLAGNDETQDISVDGNGNFYITGGMGGNPDFDPGPGVSNITSQGGVEGYLAKYDSLMNHLWAIGFGSSGTDVGYAVNAGPFGNVYVTGYFEGNADFDPSISAAILTSNGGRDAFIARYDQNGGYISAYGYGDTGDDYGRDISQDSDYNQYFTGYFAGTVDFDAEIGVNNLTSNGQTDIYVLKLDYTLNHEWAFNIGGTSYDEGYAIDATDNGLINITGYFRGLVDFDPGPGVDDYLSNGGVDIVIAQYFQCSPISSNVNDAICQGDSLFVGGAFQTTAGTYYDTLAAVNTCDSVVVTNLSILSAPTVDAGTDQTICNGDSVVVNGSGALSYAWDNGVTDGVYFYPTATLNYTVTGTGGNGCTDTDQMMVTVNALPNVDAGADTSLCMGDVLTLSGSGANTYVWDNGVTDGVAFSPTATLTYTVEGTDLNGCMDTDDILVTVNALPTVSAGADTTVCSGEMITLNGSGAQNYSWDNGATDGVPFAATTTTTYTVVGTDANGCTDQDDMTVTVNSLPTVIINSFNNDTLCLEGGVVFVPGSSPSGGTYSGPGVSGVEFDPAVAGTGNHIVIYAYTDGNGCTNSDSTSVMVVSCAGIDEFNQMAVTLFPNPNDGIFNLQFEQDLGWIEVRLYESSGKIVLTNTEQISAGTVIPFDLTAYESGLYLMYLVSDQGLLKLKIVVE